MPDEHWIPTPEEAKSVCLRVIELALHDLERPIAEVGTYEKPHSYQVARIRQVRQRQARASALQFFFDDESAFVWMCEGLSMDVEVARAGVLMRIQKRTAEDVETPLPIRG